METCKKNTKDEIDNKIKKYLSIPIPIQSYISQSFYEMVSKNAIVQKQSLFIKKENAEKL
ncbi:29414_t:CDS:2, partial [Gigaspora margarita]